jgi:hypothetical protein
MNEMNENVESQLRSWVPRAPSDKLRERLFSATNRAEEPAAPSATASHTTLPFRLSWLAPTTMAVLLMGVMYTQRNGFLFSGTNGAGPVIAMALSNQSAAAWLPGGFQHEQNSLPVETFAWTTSAGASRSNSSLPAASGSKR